MMRARFLVPVLLVAGVLGGAGSARGGDYGGYVKTQVLLRDYAADDIGALPAGQHVDLESLDGRLNADWSRGAWSLAVQAQLRWLRGDLLAGRDDPRLAGAGGTLPAIPGTADDAHQVFDLTGDLSDGRHHLLTGRLDRLAVGFSRGAWTLHAGRQASSWGGGLVFHVLDLFDPFAPDALDTEYKPGVDMLTGQWILPNGDDIQAVVVPRRGARDRPLTAGQSSAAVKWSHFTDSAQGELMAARHYGDTVLGLATTGNLAGGVWRFDLATTFPEQGDAVLSFLVNLDRSWTVAGRNVEGFAEFFRNGYGVESLGGGAAALPADLLERLDRGELFNVGRHELAAGLTCELSPLTTLEPTVLVNLNDGSSYLLGRCRYDWREDIELDAGVQLPVGGRNTEYGGVRVAALDAWLAPGRTVWARVALYY